MCIRLLSFTDILIIVPNTFHDQIADHIAEAYNKSTHSRVRINLRKNSEGERDEDEGDSEEKDGTARILKRFRNFIKVSLNLKSLGDCIAYTTYYRAILCSFLATFRPHHISLSRRSWTSTALHQRL